MAKTSKNKKLMYLLSLIGIIIFAITIYFLQSQKVAKNNNTNNATTNTQPAVTKVDPNHTKINISGKTMGTTYHISYFKNEIPNLTPEQVKAKVDDFLVDFNLKVSTYIPTSTISQFNKFDQANVPFPISQTFANIVKEAQEIAEMSEGYYDVTVYPLVKAWGFGPGKPIPSFTQDEVNQLKAHVGMDKFTLNTENDKNYLTKIDPLVQLDFSSLAKGYGVDLTGKVLEDLGAKNYIVEIGGEVVAQGLNEQNKPWTIAIEQPTYDGSDIVNTVIAISDKAIATSGNYRNFRLVDGHRITHEIDPHSGYPITHNTASLTVIADNDMRADALSTALYVMGSDKAIELANKYNIAIYCIDFVDGKFVTKESEAFKKEITIVARTN